MRPSFLPSPSRLILPLIIITILATTFDVQGQLFRRWRSAPAPTMVCGPEGCYVPQSAVVRQYRPAQVVQTVNPASLPVYSQTAVAAQPVRQVAYQPDPSITQVSEITAEEVRSDFHKAALEAAKVKLRKGEITRMQMITFRGAMLMPAFRETAEKMATVQIVMSGEVSSAVEFDDLGNVSRIDWGALAEFLERILPLLIQLLPIFL